MVSSVPYVMIGATNAPFKTVPELLAYAKANPGKLNFGVPNGAPPHMLAEMFKMQTGANIQVVPYRGASTLITDMIAGPHPRRFRNHVGDARPSAAKATSAASPCCETRAFRSFADVPTMIESGVTGRRRFVLVRHRAPPPARRRRSSNACAPKSSRACARPSSPPG